MNKLLADVFRCAMVQKPVAFSVLIIVLEGEGTERVTTNLKMKIQKSVSILRKPKFYLRGNAARQGDGLSVVQHRTGDEIAAQTQSEAPALWVIALENH